jgi:flagellar motor switch protein FliG
MAQQVPSKEETEREAAHGLSGLDKAAILMRYLGADARSLLEQLEQDSVLRISRHMLEMQPVSEEQVRAVVDEFMERAGMPTSPAFGHGAVVDFLKSALGRKADPIIQRLESPGTEFIWDKLSGAKPEYLAEYFAREQPKTTALILSYLADDKAQEVFQNFPDEYQQRVALALGRMEEVPSDLMDQIEETLADDLEQLEQGVVTSFSGLDMAASLVASVGMEASEDLLAGVSEYDEDLAEELDKRMFKFEDLDNLDDRSLQRLLREIENGELVMALKGAPEDFRERFFRNVSKRQAEMLKEDLDALGPVRVTDVDDAQQKIISTAKRLEEEGAIFLRMGGGAEEKMIE